MNIGERIEETRKAKKLSQEELSKKISKNRTMISKIEKGVSSPTLEMIVLLCKELEVTSDYLIFGTKEVSNKKDEIELLDIYRKLNSEFSVVAKYKIKELLKEQNEEIKSSVFEKEVIS